MSIFRAVCVACLLGLWGEQALASTCPKSPKGMVCIPAGSVVRGSAKAAQNERPPARIQVARFYLDSREVSNRDYQACIKARACYRRYEVKLPRYLAKPELPAGYVSWYDAQRYCRWRGKRLPTEAEWEYAAARALKAMGRTSCKNLHTSRCRPRRPLAAPAKTAKLRHLLGNQMEWVHDWYAPCYGGCKRACGASCGGAQPKGPCGGKSRCPRRRYKVLKGGSWRHRKSSARPSWRRRGYPSSYRSYIGFRCASSTAALVRPGAPLQLQPRPRLSPPKGPLSASMQRLFRQTPADNLKEKKRCPHPGRSTSSCRDPVHYIKSNEKHQHLWRPYVQDLGGAYIGIGADQNYSFLAWSRARIAWLMDYDIAIYWLHLVHRGLILHAPTSRRFLASWKKSAAKASLALLRKTYKTSPHRSKILRTYRWYRKRLYRYFRGEVTHKQRKKRGHWLATPRHYRYVRRLYRLGRIRPMPGDLLKFKSLRGVALAARKMKVVVRTLYFSNAEEFWYHPAFLRKTIALLPMDRRSVLLRSLSSYQWFSKKTSYFHYNVHHGLHYQKVLNLREPRGKYGYRHPGVYDLMVRFRRGTGFPHLTTIGLPRRKR